MFFRQNRPYVFLFTCVPTVVTHYIYVSTEHTFQNPHFGSESHPTGPVNAYNVHFVPWLHTVHIPFIRHHSQCAGSFPIWNVFRVFLQFDILFVNEVGQVMDEFKGELVPTPKTIIGFL